MFPLHVFMCTTYVSVPEGVRKVSGDPPNTGVTNGGEPPRECWEPTSGPLEE